MTLSHDLSYAVELARGAGKIALEHYGKVTRLTKTNSASTNEAVTDADRACQRHIVKGLRIRFPDDGVIGEESDTGESITFECTNPDDRNWVIDPIDGTNNFIAGMDNFAVCIGLLDGGFPVLGVVYDVTRDVMYAAAKGQGAWKGNKQIRADTTVLGPNSMLMMTSNVLRKDGKCPGWAVSWISQTDMKTRILGCAALEAIMVASGVAHGAVTVNGKLWDCAAPAAIVLESGGIMTDLTGKSIFPFDLRNYAGAKVPFLAAGPLAHAALLRQLQQNP